MSRDGTAAGRRTWDEVRQLAEIGDAALPWPVVTATRLGLHASRRRFYRLAPATEESDPATVVLVLYAPEDADEVARYVRTAAWFAAAGVRVPAVYHAGNRSLIVEDGGDRLLSDEAPGASLPSAYEHAVAAIAALQDHGHGGAGPNPGWALDAGRLRTELEFTEQNALRGWLGGPPCAARTAAFDRLAADVAALPAAMCHRDYHSRNLLLVPEGLMVLDFQDVMLGPRYYDLVSLLHDDYRDVPAVCRAAALSRFGAYDRRAYCLTLAQRALKALGTFGYQISIGGRSEYESFAPRTWGHARWALRELGRHEDVEHLGAFDSVLGSA